MNDNPLIDFDSLPRFAEISPQQVASAVDNTLAAAAKKVEAIAADTALPAWENVGLPLEYIGNDISRVWNQVEHMHSVMSTPEWRDAYHTNLPKIITFFSALGQNEGIYRRWCALAKSSAFATLPPARQKIVTDGLRDFQLSGVALPDEQKTTVRQNSERLAMLSAKFEENLLAATNDFSLDVMSADELGDMPTDLRDNAKQVAKNADIDGWRFTLQPPSYIAFMRYVTTRPLREKMYRAYNTRASEFDKAERDNTPLMDEILQKRRAQALLLGFDSYADMALKTRMAPTAKAADDFLRDLTDRALPHAKREMDELKQFAADTLNINDLAVWDVSYVAEQLRQRRFDFSDADLRPYLQEDKILTGLFACIQQLFGITVREASASVWRDDVRYLELLNADGTLIGGLYMDLYASDTKRGGAWMADALSRCQLAKKLQLPVAHIACNFVKPTAGVALLDWQEVVTLFHECGHALHHLLTEIDDYSVSGISGVEWDAVELPSQWLENFVWDWRVLEPMTAHTDSDERMPWALFDKVLAARRFHSGLWLIRQLEFSLFDLSLHRLPKVPSVQQVLGDVRQLTAMLPLPADNRFACGFSHIFAGGYAAGYYSYLWAEVLAADIFVMFTESGNILNTTLGEQFRRQVLAVGGSRPAMDSFVAMRGREPTIEPLLTYYGLVA